MKKYKLFLVTLSPRTEDGDRKTLEQAEICSSASRGTIELIKHLLQDQTAYRETTKTEYTAAETIRQLVICR